MDLLDIDIQSRVVIGISAMLVLFASFLVVFISNQRKKIQYHKSLLGLHAEQQQQLKEQNLLLEQRVKERTSALSEQTDTLQKYRDPVTEIPEKKPFYKSKVFKATIVPAALIGYGLSTIKDNGFYSSYDAQEDILREFPNFDTWLDDAFLVVEGNHIASYGPMSGLTYQPKDFDEHIDARGKFIFPSWCDSHTHLVFAGSREQEFVDKIHGLSHINSVESSFFAILKAELIKPTWL